MFYDAFWAEAELVGEGFGALGWMCLSEWMDVYGVKNMKAERKERQQCLVSKVMFVLRVLFDVYMYISIDKEQHFCWTCTPCLLCSAFALSIFFETAFFFCTTTSLSNRISLD